MFHLHFPRPLEPQYHGLIFHSPHRNSAVNPVIPENKIIIIIFSLELMSDFYCTNRHTLVSIVGPISSVSRKVFWLSTADSSPLELPISAKSNCATLAWGA